MHLNIDKLTQVREGTHSEAAAHHCWQLDHHDVFGGLLCNGDRGGVRGRPLLISLYTSDCFRMFSHFGGTLIVPSCRSQ